MLPFASQERLLTQEEILESTGQTESKHMGIPSMKVPAPLGHHRDHDDSTATSTMGHRWTEEEYLRNAIPWESPEQKAHIDFLLERRAHYRMVRLLSLLSLMAVALLGWILGWLVVVRRSVESTTSSSFTSSPSSSLSNLYVVGLLCMAPLVRMSWEGQTQHTVVQNEIQSLTKQRMLLIPTPPTTPLVSRCQST